MPTLTDPFDVLAALNPVPDETVLPPTRAYVPAQRALQRILANGPALLAGADPRATPDTSAPPQPAPEAGGGGRGGRRRFVLLGVAVIATTALTAAAAVLAVRGADDPARIACYAAPDLEADTAVLPVSPGADPLLACAEVWRSGDFQGWGTVPPLAGCVQPGGHVAVFPGEPSVCDRLGLPRLATESGDWEARVVQLVDSLTTELAAPSCVDVAAAADLVRQRLEQLDLDGWTLIAPATVVPERPCASIAFDPPAKTITLVPVPLPND